MEKKSFVKLITFSIAFGAMLGYILCIELNKKEPNTNFCTGCGLSLAVERIPDNNSQLETIMFYYELSDGRYLEYYIYFDGSSMPLSEFNNLKRWEYDNKDSIVFQGQKEFYRNK